MEIILIILLFFNSNSPDLKTCRPIYKVGFISESSEREVYTIEKLMLKSCLLIRFSHVRYEKRITRPASEHVENSRSFARDYCPV